MTTPKVTIHNASTGETVVRNMNSAELAQLELDKEADEVRAEAVAVKASARVALLEKLGITEAEAQLLLGS